MIIRAGIGVFAAACLSGCDDIRPPTVWDGVTAQFETDLIACLDNKEVFGEFQFVSVYADRSHVNSQTYITENKEVFVAVVEATGSPRKVVARSDRGLKQAEILALETCSNQI